MNPQPDRLVRGPQFVPPQGAGLVRLGGAAGTACGRLAPELAIHVGIASGVAAAGGIGSEHYLQYAIIGEPTNVASRICTLASDGQIFVDERTANGLEGEWSLERLEPARVKGKAKPLTLYRVQWE